MNIFSDKISEIISKDKNPAIVIKTITNKLQCLLKIERINHTVLSYRNSALMLPQLREILLILGITLRTSLYWKELSLFTTRNR
jgi:hypothetical protein